MGEQKYDKLRIMLGPSDLGFHYPVKDKSISGDSGMVANKLGVVHLFGRHLDIWRPRGLNITAYSDWGQIVQSIK